MADSDNTAACTVYVLPATKRTTLDEKQGILAKQHFDVANAIFKAKVVKVPQNVNDGNKSSVTMHSLIVKHESAL